MLITMINFHHLFILIKKILFQLSIKALPIKVKPLAIVLFFCELLASN